MENALNVFGILAGVGVMAAGFGFAYSQFKLGSDKIKDNLISTLKETAEAEKVKAERLATEKITLVDSHQTQINELNNKMGKLQGLYEAAEAGKKEYLAILQGRDPAQQKFMEFMMEAGKSSNETTAVATKYMTDSIVILQQIRTFMEKLNTSADKNNKFLDEVVADTAHGEGKVLKKKV